MSISIEQVIHNAGLMSLPDLYLRLRSVLGDPEFSLASVADVISQDPAITTRLLRMVNSPYFGFVSKIDTVSRAVSMLGTQQVHDLVLATSVTKVFAGLSSQVMDMAAFWRSSVYCAVLSRQLAFRCRLLDNERLFVAGLLRDIGHLPMYQSIPELSQKALQRARSEDKPLFRIERDLIGFDYAQVGGSLMQKWALPKSLWEIARYHTEPGRTREHSLEISIMHIASAVTEGVSLKKEPEECLMHIEPVAWTNTTLAPETVLEVQPETDRQLEAAVDLILGGNAAAA
jgi:HD-like signal output (HDOD) protein